MRRFVSLCLLSVACVAVAPSGASAVTVGISDQQASTFSNSLYAPLHLKVARYIAPYDVLQEPDQLEQMQAWLVAARMAHQRVLLSVEHSRLSSQYNKAPSVSTYTKDIKALKAKFGSYIQDFSPWNEVNVCQAPGRLEGQPKTICKSSTGPKRVAQYYAAARKVFKGHNIVGIDILDGSNVSGSVAYLKKFKKYARPLPKIWGIHNYSDTNRGSTSRTKRLIAAIGDSRAQVWLTETGGQLKLRGKYYGGTFASGEKSAAKALECMFYMPKKFKQIKRIYVYQFNGAPDSNDFDAGLIGLDNSKRTGYSIVQHRKAKACHA